MRISIIFIMKRNPVGSFFGTLLLFGFAFLAFKVINPLEFFHKTLAEAATGSPLHRGAADPDDLLQAREIANRHLAEFSVRQGESWLMEGKPNSGVGKVEVRGLQIAEPSSPFLTEADKLNSITGKLLFPLRATAHRRTRANGTWTEWYSGPPVLFSGIETRKVHGQWQVTSSPAKYYQTTRAAGAEEKPLVKAR
jgi:hypothetical protein